MHLGKYLAHCSVCDPCVGTSRSPGFPVLGNISQPFIHLLIFVFQRTDCEPQSGLIYIYFYLKWQVEEVKLLEWYTAKKPATGTLYLTGTHLIFVETSCNTRKETWVWHLFRYHGKGWEPMYVLWKHPWPFLKPCTPLMFTAMKALDRCTLSWCVSNHAPW